ncbi:MAG TPA: FMN-binding protein [Candidatus Limnocylindrales bacterium]|jgi:uncharacterized protein with FMN-binding domain
MPKRAMIASLLTTAALILLISFKTPTATTFGTGGNAPVVIPSTAPGASSQIGTTGQPGATTQPATGAKGTFTGQKTGTAVQIPFGTVQVQVTFQNGKITDVQAVQMPSDQRHSAEISSAVAPMLHDEVLQAQSAQVNTISGATYTSQGYLQSLQSALDQAATA